MYWPLGLVVLASTVPVTWVCLRTRRRTPACRGRSRTRSATWRRAWRRGATGCGSSSRSAGPISIFDSFDARSVRLYETSLDRVRVSAVLDLPRRHPQRHADHRAAGALAVAQGQLTLGTLVAFITLMLSLVWPVAALGFLLAMTQECDDRRRPDRGDLRRRERHRRRDSRRWPRYAASWRSRTSRSGSRTRTPTCCTT